jgi:4-aminobutyrate aminotransferase-like enzyme
MDRNAELLPRLNACVPKGVSTKALFISRAENAELWDVDDRRYLDFAAGIAVLNTGPRHPRVMQAVAKQLEMGLC